MKLDHNFNLQTLFCFYHVNSFVLKIQVERQIFLTHFKTPLLYVNLLNQQFSLPKLH